MERSEVNFRHDEIEVIIYPSKCFSRKMDYVHLAFGRKVQVGHINLLLNIDHFYLCKDKVIRTKYFPNRCCSKVGNFNRVLGAGGRNLRKVVF